MSGSWEELLRCPRDGGELEQRDAALICGRGHVYPAPGGIPVLLVGEIEPTQWWYWTDEDQLEQAEEEDVRTDGIDAWVEQGLVLTHGNLYRKLPDSLTEYPIPAWPLDARARERVLDIGCNWGRWSVAAARAGHDVVGIDPNIDAVRAARRVAAQLDVGARYLVADGRRLPFPDGRFDLVFSYSVLQHFSRVDARSCIEEMGRVLAPGGRAVVQMASATGLHNLLLQLRRGFRDPGEFNVRYWRPGALVRTFSELVGPASLSADGYFSLNPQLTDLHLLRPAARLVVRISHTLNWASANVHPLVYLADSVWVTAARPAGDP